MTSLGFKKAFDTVAHKGLMLSVSKSSMEREPQGLEGARPDPQDRPEGPLPSPLQPRRAGPSSGKGAVLRTRTVCGHRPCRLQGCGLPSSRCSARGHTSAQCPVQGLETAGRFSSRRE